MLLLMLFPLRVICANNILSGEHNFMPPCYAPDKSNKNSINSFYQTYLQHNATKRIILDQKTQCEYDFKYQKEHYIITDNKDHHFNHAKINSGKIGTTDQIIESVFLEICLAENPETDCPPNMTIKTTYDLLDHEYSLINESNRMGFFVATPSDGHKVTLSLSNSKNTGLYFYGDEENKPIVEFNFTNATNIEFYNLIISNFINIPNLTNFKKCDFLGKDLVSLGRVTLDTQTLMTLNSLSTHKTLLYGHLSSNESGKYGLLKGIDNKESLIEIAETLNIHYIMSVSNDIIGLKSSHTSAIVYVDTNTIYVLNMVLFSDEVYCLTYNATINNNFTRLFLNSRGDNVLLDVYGNASPLSLYGGAVATVIIDESNVSIGHIGATVVRFDTRSTKETRIRSAQSNIVCNHIEILSPYITITIGILTDFKVNRNFIFGLTMSESYVSRIVIQDFLLLQPNTPTTIKMNYTFKKAFDEMPIMLKPRRLVRVLQSCQVGILSRQPNVILPENYIHGFFEGDLCFKIVTSDEDKAIVLKWMSKLSDMQVVYTMGEPLVGEIPVKTATEMQQYIEQSETTSQFMKFKLLGKSVKANITGTSATTLGFYGLDSETEMDLYGIIPRIFHVEFASISIKPSSTLTFEAIRIQAVNNVEMMGPVDVKGTPILITTLNLIESVFSNFTFSKIDLQTNIERIHLIDNLKASLSCGNKTVTVGFQLMYVRTNNHPVLSTEPKVNLDFDKFVFVGDFQQWHLIIKRTNGIFPHVVGKLICPHFGMTHIYLDGAAKLPEIMTEQPLIHVMNSHKRLEMGSMEYSHDHQFRVVFEESSTKRELHFYVFKARGEWAMPAKESIDIIAEVASIDQTLPDFHIIKKLVAADTNGTINADIVENKTLVVVKWRNSLLPKVNVSVVPGSIQLLFEDDDKLENSIRSFFSQRHPILQGLSKEDCMKVLERTSINSTAKRNYSLSFTCSSEGSIYVGAQNSNPDMSTDPKDFNTTSNITNSDAIVMYSLASVFIATVIIILVLFFVIKKKNTRSEKDLLTGDSLSLQESVGTTPLLS